MRAHGRGGSLLVVPSKTGQWRESVMQPVLYALEPPFPALADLMQNRATESPDRGWLDALRRAVDGVAGLTTSTAWRAWLEVQRRFHRYSWGNTLLIYVMGNITPS